MNEVEEWRPIPGYGDHYEASSFGRIRVKARVAMKWNAWAKRDVAHRLAPRVLAQSNSGRYFVVTLVADGVKYTRNVHSLVLHAFVGPRPNGLLACHGDDNSRNNTASNLRWDTPTANSADAIRNGRLVKGERHHWAKLSDEVAAKIAATPGRLEDVAASYGVSRAHVHRLRTGIRGTEIQKP